MVLHGNVFSSFVKWAWPVLTRTKMKSSPKALLEEFHNRNTKVFSARDQQPKDTNSVHRFKLKNGEHVSYAFWLRARTFWVDINRKYRSLWCRSLFGRFQQLLFWVWKLAACWFVWPCVLLGVEDHLLNHRAVQVRKGLDAYNQFVSGWVKDIKIWSVSDKYLTEWIKPHI